MLGTKSKVHGSESFFLVVGSTDAITQTVAVRNVLGPKRGSSASEKCLKFAFGGSFINSGWLKRALAQRGEARIFEPRHHYLRRRHRQCTLNWVL